MRALLLASLVLLALLGCGGVPGAREPARVPPAKPPPPSAREYALDRSSLTIEATVHHAVASTIRFHDTRGRIVAAASDPEATVLDVTIVLRSGDSTPALVADIAEREFLHTDRFATATLRSTSVRRAEGGTYDVFLELELHGVVRKLRVPARIDIRACSVSLDTEFSIDRRRFGLVADGSIDDVVDDEVDILVAVRAARPCAAR